MFIPDPNCRVSFIALRICQFHNINCIVSILKWHVSLSFLILFTNLRPKFLLKTWKFGRYEFFQSLKQKLYISCVRYNNHRTNILIPKRKNRKTQKDYFPEEYGNPKRTATPYLSSQEHWHKM